MSTHRLSKTREYHIWQAMIQRCTDKKWRDYGDYGGRGISVCHKWSRSYAAFLADMGPRPTTQHSIERKNNNGNYEPGNCRWATRQEQANNKRNSRFLEFHGRQLTVASWARETGLGVSCILGRLRLGWSASDALTLPPTNKWAHAKASALNLTVKDGATA